MMIFGISQKMLSHCEKYYLFRVSHCDMRLDAAALQGRSPPGYAGGTR